jgi:hypothetical protein
MRERIRYARDLAAALLRAEGKEDDAQRILNGQGDDYPEVKLASSAVAANLDRVARLERALRCYADPTFWDEENPDAALALHDRGEIARAALKGRELFDQHRD